MVLRTSRSTQSLIYLDDSESGRKRPAYSSLEVLPCVGRSFRTCLRGVWLRTIAPVLPLEDIPPLLAALATIPGENRRLANRSAHSPCACDKIDRSIGARMESLFEPIALSYGWDLGEVLMEERVVTVD